MTDGLTWNSLCEVFRAGKPVFIDKPTGSKLSEVVAIFRAAKHYNVPMFSSSSLRYSDGAQAIRGGKDWQGFGLRRLQSLFLGENAR